MACFDLIQKQGGLSQCVAPNLFLMSARCDSIPPLKYAATFKLQN